MSIQCSMFSNCCASAVALAALVSQSIMVPGRAEQIASFQPIGETAIVDREMAGREETVGREVLSDLSQHNEIAQLPAALPKLETNMSLLEVRPLSSLRPSKSAESFQRSAEFLPELEVSSFQNSAFQNSALVGEDLLQPEIPAPVIEGSEPDGENTTPGALHPGEAIFADLEESPFASQLDRAAALRERGEVAAAIAIYETLLQQNPGNATIGETLALVYIEQGDYDRSVQLLEQLVATAPQNLDLQASLAWAYGWQGKLDRGIALYETILQQEPGHLKAQLGLAEFLSWQGKPNEAIALYGNIVEQYPDNLEARFKQAQSISWRGKHRQALALYDQILEQNPQHQKSQLERAQVLNWAGKQTLAIAAYDRILQQEPGHLQARLGKAQALSWAGRRKAAIALYETILEQDPNHLDAQLGRAEAWTRSDRFREGLALYEAILQQYPDSVEALHGQAQATHQLGHPKRAIALYQEALEQFPDSPKLRSGLARVYYSQQRIRRALDVLEPLLKQENPDALALQREIRAVPVEVNVRNDSHDNRSDLLIQQTARFRINNSDTIQSISTGLHFFDQDNFESLRNTPVQIGIEGQVDRVSLKGTVGINLFDRISAAPNLGFEVSSEVLPNVFLSGIAEYGPHQFNVETLENGIAATRIGPNLYWQIDRDTDLFASLRWGTYNDGNQELESLIYLERRFEGFFVAGSLYTLSFANDLENGYFAPSNYLFYGGEVGWEGNLTDSLRCRLSVGLGGQQLEGEPSSANNYQARCTATFSPNLEAGVGYRYSNLIDQNSSESDSTNQSWFGHLRVTF